jgi:hypothetical protein
MRERARARAYVCWTQAERSPGPLGRSRSIIIDRDGRTVLDRARALQPGLAVGGKAHGRLLRGRAGHDAKKGRADECHASIYIISAKAVGGFFLGEVFGVGWRLSLRGSIGAAAPESSPTHGPTSARTHASRSGRFRPIHVQTGASIYYLSEGRRRVLPWAKWLWVGDSLRGSGRPLRPPRQQSHAWSHERTHARFAVGPFPADTDRCSAAFDGTKVIGAWRRIGYTVQS